MMTVLSTLFYSWARSIKTRIETLRFVDGAACYNNIREQDPLKQGLKLNNLHLIVIDILNSWARSIKTRIETYFHKFTCPFLYNSWARSIKTRIETIIYADGVSCYGNSWARSIKTRIETMYSHRPISWLMHSWARSIKTRIETHFLNILYHFMSRIREQDPLKQGLKRCFVLLVWVNTFIREQDPLKQGLKPRSCTCFYLYTLRFVSKIH